MLSLTCPICLYDLTDRVMDWITESLPGPRACHCVCCCLEVTLSEPALHPGSGMYASFSSRGLRVSIWVDLLDGVGTAWLATWRPEGLRLLGPLRGSRRSRAWDATHRSAIVDSVMSS